MKISRHWHHCVNSASSSSTLASSWCKGRTNNLVAVLNFGLETVHIMILTNSWKSRLPSPSLSAALINIITSSSVNTSPVGWLVMLITSKMAYMHFLQSYKTWWSQTPPSPSPIIIRCGVSEEELEQKKKLYLDHLKKDPTLGFSVNLLLFITNQNYDVGV